jgi:DNA-directed RNA polymerase specialized sigma24 family protein
MKLPSNMTEDEVLAIINNVANRLASRFKFGYHSIEDMKQQARLFAVRSMEKYDESRPLENFLWTCVHNLLFNYKRDNYLRHKSPCHKCDKQETCKEDCKILIEWEARNTSRQNLMFPVTMENVDGEGEDNMGTTYDLEAIVDNAELMKKIDRELPVELRHDFVRLKLSLRLAKNKRDILFSCIKDILEVGNNND